VTDARADRLAETLGDATRSTRRLIIAREASKETLRERKLRLMASEKKVPFKRVALAGRPRSCGSVDGHDRAARATPNARSTDASVEKSIARGWFDHIHGRSRRRPSTAHDRARPAAEPRRGRFPGPSASAWGHGETRCAGSDAHASTFGSRRCRAPVRRTDRRALLSITAEDEAGSARGPGAASIVRPTSAAGRALNPGRARGYPPAAAAAEERRYGPTLRPDEVEDPLVTLGLAETRTDVEARVASTVTDGTRRVGPDAFASLIRGERGRQRRPRSFRGIPAPQRYREEILRRRRAAQAEQASALRASSRASHAHGSRAGPRAVPAPGGRPGSEDGSEAGEFFAAVQRQRLGDSEQHSVGFLASVYKRKLLMDASMGRPGGTRRARGERLLAGLSEMMARRRQQAERARERAAQVRGSDPGRAREAVAAAAPTASAPGRPQGLSIVVETSSEEEDDGGASGPDASGPDATPDRPGPESGRNSGADGGEPNVKARHGADDYAAPHGPPLERRAGKLLASSFPVKRFRALHTALNERIESEGLKRRINYLRAGLDGSDRPLNGGETPADAAEVPPRELLSPKPQTRPAFFGTSAAGEAAARLRRGGAARMAKKPRHHASLMLSPKKKRAAPALP
jgi:hypothetical protein